MTPKEKFKRCGEGENLCNCKTYKECGYLFSSPIESEGAEQELFHIRLWRKVDDLIKQDKLETSLACLLQGINNEGRSGGYQSIGLFLDESMKRELSTDQIVHIMNAFGPWKSKIYSADKFLEFARKELTERNPDSVEALMKVCFEDGNPFPPQKYKKVESEGAITLQAEILGVYNSWTLVDVLKKLVDATEILLKKKDYDGPYYEEMEICVSRAKETIQLLSQNPAKSLSEGKGLNGWISVEDRLPEPNSEYLITINGNSTGVAYYESVGYINQFIRADYDDFEHENVTHWQPLPPSPVKEDNKKEL